MSKPFHFDTWKFASRCKWCTINYFTIIIGYLVGIYVIDSFLIGVVLGFIAWGIIAYLHEKGFLDDPDADDDDDNDDDKPEDDNFVGKEQNTVFVK